MWEQVKLKQILLITDGCSNLGINPVHAAEIANQSGIAVNVIGIIDGNRLSEKALREVQEIASAGGGIHRIVELNQLAQTMHMMTRYTVQMTIQKVVNQELKSMIGKELQELTPESRIEVAYMMDQAGEEAEIRLVLLIDVSASMRNKLPQVREAIRDLEIGIQSRKGTMQVAVMAYPSRNDTVKMVVPFTESPALSAISSELVTAGGTPTGPALEQAIQLLTENPIEQQVTTYGQASSYVV